MSQVNPPADSRTMDNFIPFPKITGKVKDFLFNLERLKQDSAIHTTEISMEGTVKLHGMHADIVYDLRDDAAGVQFQSRNRICDPDESQRGWPQNLAGRSRELSSLKAKIMLQSQKQYPSTKIDPSQPLVVAGEWIGTKVQPGVGISSLSTRFVILGIQINGMWQPNSVFASIEEPSAAIYSVLRVPQFVVRYDTSDRSPSNPALLEMQRLSDQVEAACPYAAHFGIQNSRGEGIVWKPGIPGGRADTKYWFKMKGPISDPQSHITKTTSVPVPVLPTMTPEVGASKWVTARRVEQAFEYLEEIDFSTAGKREKAFIKWITNDILTEEQREIELWASDDLTFEKSLRQSIYFRARNIYLESISRVSRGPRVQDGPHQLQNHRAEGNEKTNRLERADGQTLDETSTTAEAATPKTAMDVDKVCSERDPLPIRAMTNEERFLEAMEKMLRR